MADAGAAAAAAATDADPEMRRNEHLPVEIYPDARAASAAVAADIAALIRARAAEGRQVVLGLATGSSPLSLYAELVRLHREEGLSFANVVAFNLDEYYPMDPNDLQSYVRFMRERLFDHVDIPAGAWHVPDGTVPCERVAEYCRDYEARIAAAGGLDVQVLGIGRTGHIGFNEPGSSERSRTRLLMLNKVTRVDAAAAFFGEHNVPRRALSMGVGTILGARRIYLLAWGEDKAEIVARAAEGPPDASVPATWLQRHSDARFVLDEPAAAALARRRAPWTLGNVDWAAAGPRFVRKAVAWLALKVGKPLLALTDEDYLEGGLGDLAAAAPGGAADVNLAVFKDLTHLITGWPGGKPGADDAGRPERAAPHPKRVLVFSPHPDDDVISMGGTLARLVQQGHEVHVAYQTSGSIAVADDDALRYVDFAVGLADALAAAAGGGHGGDSGNGACNGSGKDSGQSQEHTAAAAARAAAGDLHERVRAHLAAKASRPGLPDTREVLAVKTLIRLGEARAACRHVGVPEARAHFLNLPFYESGRIRKLPLSAADVDIVEALLRRVRPHLVFAAGDLSDPHGTHRTCLSAVLHALQRVQRSAGDGDDSDGGAWLQDCRVWLYRGAWCEYGVDEADMVVPLSPEDLASKRLAIFKHQSQKDRPLFPGPDAREFWQRAEARNRETAALLNRLGLPEYHAAEAFARLRLDDPRGLPRDLLGGSAL